MLRLPLSIIQKASTPKIINNLKYPSFCSSKSPATYYQTLNLTPPSTEEQIKSAYLQMVKKYHPDLNKNPYATQKFKQIQQAYDYLIDPNNRIQKAERSAPSSNPEEEETIRSFREKYYTNYKRKQNTDESMQFSYGLYKKHDELVKEKKKKYKKYHGQDKEYYARQDQESTPLWKAVGIGALMIGIGAGTIWVVNLK